MIRVLLVDDHPVVRGGIRGMLSAEADLDVVGDAGSGPEALVRVAELSPREIEVLRLAADGRTNAAIGRSLHISATTVKTHLMRV